MAVMSYKNKQAVLIFLNLSRHFWTCYVGLFPQPLNHLGTTEKYILSQNNYSSSFSKEDGQDYAFLVNT